MFWGCPARWLESQRKAIPLCEAIQNEGGNPHELSGGSGCVAARYSLGPAPASWLGLALRATAVHPSASRCAPLRRLCRLSHPKFYLDQKNKPDRSTKKAPEAHLITNLSPANQKQKKKRGPIFFKKYLYLQAGLKGPSPPDIKFYFALLY